MRSDGRPAEGVCGLQSLEWEEAQVLNWDELPEASPLDLIAGLTLDRYPDVNPGNQVLRVHNTSTLSAGRRGTQQEERRRGPVTE